MSLQKIKPYRSKKLRNLARDCPICMCCGKPNDGTIVAAHYTGLRQQEFGKGMGQKCTDTATAYLCHECHTKFDTYRYEDNIDSSELFLLAIVRTHDYLFLTGVIK